VTAPAARSRRYLGVTPEDRRASRRERLLDAGLEVFGTIGYAESSIKAILLESGLNQRYFYESFEGREALLEAVYVRIIEGLISSALEAVVDADGAEDKVSAGLATFWAVVAGDLRKGRIIAIEVVGVSKAVETRRREVRQAFASFIAEQAMSTAGLDDTSGFYLDPLLTAHSLVGAVIELLVAYLHEETDASIDDLVEHSIRLFTSTGRVAAYGPGSVGAAGPDHRRRLRRRRRPGATGAGVASAAAR